MRRVGLLPPTMQTPVLAILVLAELRWIFGRPTTSQQHTPSILALMMANFHALEMSGVVNTQQTITVATATPKDVTSTVTIKAT